MIRRILLLALCVSLSLISPASEAQEKKAETGFLPKVHKGKDGESKYVVFVPHDYKGDKEYPVILFLHGAGERGIDGEVQVKQGIGSAIRFKETEKKFPFIVVFPQCKTMSNWKAGGEDANRALAILDEVQKDYKTDPKRVYLTGLSMGGSGTWSLAAAHPDKWAAIVPICGGGEPEIVEKIKHIPCWYFVGDKDREALVQGNRALIESLKKAGGSPRYTEYPFVGHNSWDSAYVTPELYPWLLSHKAK